jgi:antitoxin PrlF
MASATVTSKGQVTIPVDVRNQIGLGAGDRIEFILNDETGRYEILPANRSVTALKGIIRKPAKPVSIEEINSAIDEQGASAR